MTERELSLMLEKKRGWRTSQAQAIRKMRRGCTPDGVVSHPVREAGIIVGICLVLSLIILLVSATIGHAQVLRPAYSDEQIVSAIFLAEGGWKAKFLYGIRSVKYANKEEARKICFNTVRNNRRRYLKDSKGCRDFIEYLARVYCPLKARNDPKGLNKNWLKNVLYFLERDA